MAWQWKEEGVAVSFMQWQGLLHIEGLLPGSGIPSTLHCSRQGSNPFMYICSQDIPEVQVEAATMLLHHAAARLGFNMGQTSWSLQLLSPRDNVSME